MSTLVLRMLAAFAVAEGIGSASFDVLLDVPRSHFPHVWEESVGSGHMAMALRADWREHMKRARAELGFKRVRMHGMLNDDMSVSLGPPVPDSHPPLPGGYSFVNLNSVIDFLASIEMDAFFEVGFMPRWLASNASSTVFHYRGITSPPRNYSEWGEVVETVARHLHDRYGEETVARWFFEIWNEPNIHFWAGDPQQATYFQLYRETVQAFHRVSPSFRVGGPATSGLAWIPDFLDYCSDSGAGQPDFVSTHQYAGGDKGNIYNVAGLVSGFERAHKDANGVPLVISEWGGSWAHMPQLDDTAYAPFIVAVLAGAQNLTSIMSLWCVSDVFEEAGMPSNDVTYSAGFGLMNVYGVPKPSYRALQLMRWAGDRRVPVARRETSSSQCESADVLALMNATHLALLVTNQAPLPLEGEDPVQQCAVTVHLSSSFAGPAVVARIDDGHANPKAAWEKMGSPAYPTPGQLAELEAASEFQLEAITVDEDGSVSVSLPRGVAAIFVPLASDVRV